MPDDVVLDLQQQAAVAAPERAIAVLAGPGSGKTRVLSHRARHLLALHTGSSALLLTFTNKAAAEMKARALAVAVVATHRIRAETYHSFAMRVLRSHGAHVGIEPDYDILDVDEQKQLAKDVALSAGIQDLRARWTEQRLRQVLPEREVASFGERYEQAKRDAGVVDFDDLIIYAAELFQQRPAIAQAYATRYPHLLVDEFQDTNAAEFALVRALALHASTISVFADDDQAIFGFAGAEADNIRRFSGELQARQYPLTTNYRCREAIVSCANRLIAANASGSGRQMKASKSGGDVVTEVFRDMTDEAASVCDGIAAQIEAGASPAHISVLVRNGYRAREILSELTRRQIPVSNWLVATYNSAEQRVVRACLSVARGTLTARCRQRLCELLGVEDSDATGALDFLQPHADKPGVQNLLNIHRLANEGASVLRIVEEVGYCIDAVETDREWYADFVAEVQAFIEHDPDYSLEHLLSELALGGKGGAPTESGGVKVATLHRTKGLQWPIVYLVGMEDEHLPDYRIETDEDLQEERRLCFVGVCRAEDRLVLTRITQFKGHHKDPSPFLAEMGA